MKAEKTTWREGGDREEAVESGERRAVAGGNHLVSVLWCFCAGASTLGLQCNTNPRNALSAWMAMLMTRDG